MPDPAGREPPSENRFTGSPIVELLGKLARAQELTPAAMGGAGTEPAATSIWQSPPTLLSELHDVLGARLGSAGGLTPIVEALKAVHSASQAKSGGNGTRYEENHLRFAELEAKLREQSDAVERLLGAAVTGKAPLHGLQQTLVLTCRQGGKTRGQFRCVNKTGRAAHVDLRARSLRSDTKVLSGAVIAFEPNGKRLEADEAAVFTIEIDLAACVETSDETLEASVDIYLNTELTLRLFVYVDVQGDGLGATESHR